MAAKKGRKLTKRGLAEKLDKVFSLYIRQKDKDENGGVRCYTCNCYKHWKDMHCGHFISRTYYSTRWEEDNCRPQDVSCNIYHQGMQYQFGKKLEAEIGVEAVNNMIQKKHTPAKYSIGDYLEMIEKYNKKLRDLNCTEL